MKIILISWMLLVLEVTLNSGHYIYRVEKQDAPAYEVESNLKGLVLVNTKHEKPTLKDILYHNLIERFFGIEEPLITERSFSNSHGLPFLEDLDNETVLQNDESEKVDDELFEEAEPKPLTDEAVKAAYKSKSYLFDQMRQRSDVISPDLLERKKRQAEIPYFPEAPGNSYQDPTAPPKTYGMNLNPNGGYVWNNLNNPSLYELGQSPNGYENAGQNPPQSSETPAPEEYTSSAPENVNSGSSEDIYVNINKPTARPLENEETVKLNEPRDIPEKNESGAENPITSNDNSDSFEPREPVESVLTEVKPDEPKTKPLEIPESPVESVSEFNSQEAKEAEPAPVNEDAVEMEAGIPAETSSMVPVEDVSSGETAVNSDGDKIKEIPEAPTLPPLNYDSLPDYIRQSISSTERSEYEQTDKPFLNPQPSSEDKKETEDNIEDILATAQPVEDIPKTYGMNLTSGSGRVWNDLVNPPVSYEVGSTENNQSEVTQATAIIEEPVTAVEQPTVSENPSEEPEKEKENIAPIEIPEVTEQLENASIEPVATLPTETADEEIKPNTELPESISTTEKPEAPETTEPVVNVPETEANNEDNNANTELPEIISTTQIIETPETQMPDIEPVTEEIKPNTDLPEIISTTEQPASINEDEVNKPNNDGIAPIEPVITVAPAEEPVNPGTEEPESGSGETGDKVAEPGKEKPDVANEKPDIMSEVLKSEQFWKWLGEWTATYMELMEKHMRKIAIQEICNSKQAVDMCLLDKPEDSGSIIKGGKVTIDGKEIDLNDHFNQLKRVNKGNSVDATTIYGNSVGNEKVTNVFIFNPNNAKDILEGLKPENDSKVNILIEDKNKGVSEPEQNMEITEDKGIEDRGDGDAKVEIPEVEDIKEVTEEPVKAVGKSDENKDEIVSEDVKEVEKDTVPEKDAVESKDDNIEVADVKEVKPDSKELGIENVTEAK